MQSTWAASSETWGTAHVWANDTYSHSIIANSSLGTSDVANVTMPVSADITQILLSELHDEDRVSLLNGTLASALGLTTSCVLVLPVSGSMSITTAGTGSSVMLATGLATLSSGHTTTSNNNTVYPATATFSSVLENVNDEDKVTLINTALEATYGIISVSVLKAVGNATLPISTGVVNNINYPESLTIQASVSTSSASSFLWNSETESTDAWTAITEETTDWTEQTEDDTTWT
jgi:hypothetical protein